MNWSRPHQIFLITYICSCCEIKDVVKKVKQRHSLKYIITWLKWQRKVLGFDHTCS